MSALAITMTTDQGLFFGLALLAAGMITQAWITRWSEADDDPIVPLEDAQDESINLTIEVEQLEPTVTIPVQRGGSR